MWVKIECVSEWLSDEWWCVVCEWLSECEWVMCGRSVYVSVVYVMGDVCMSSVRMNDS
jgi:hypothetical protein